MRTNLKNARQKAGLTQEKVAGMLGISLRQYKYIESAQVVGKVELWDKLEDLFKIHQRVLRENHPGIKDSQ